MTEIREANQAMHEINALYQEIEMLLGMFMNPRSKLEAIEEANLKIGEITAGWI